MKKWILYLLLSSKALLAQDTLDLVHPLLIGNEAYEKGDYSKAIEAYELLVQDYQSADLYKNLGNAYFRQNQLGKSILYFEKAVKLDPGNEDALFNLNFARNLTVDRLGEGSNDKISTFFRSLITSTKPNNWAYWSIAMVFFLFLILAAMLLNKKIRIKRMLFLVSLVLAFFSLTLIVMAHQSKRIANTFSHAIIIGEKVDVKSEPNWQSADLFVLHEGAKVELMESAGEWIEIMIPNGTKGWIKQEDLGKI